MARPAEASRKEYDKADADFQTALKKISTTLRRIWR